MSLRRTAFGVCRVAGLAFASLPPLAAPPPHSSKPDYRVLVFTKMAGERHASIHAGVQAIRRLGKDGQFFNLNWVEFVGGGVGTP